MLLRVLGRLALELPDRPATGAAAQRQPLALLAVLAAAGAEGMSRERLQALLWPESDTERARGALNQTLYTLRRDTGARDLVGGGAVLTLSPAALTCDLWEFERAAAVGDVDGALAAYGGPLLDGVALLRAGEFERWVDGERAHIAARLAGVLAAGAAAATAAGDHARAAALLARRAEAEPLDGRSIAAWMQALVAAGDRAGALRAAARHEARARTEFEAEPAAEVMAYAATLRRAGGSVGAGSRDVAPAADAPVAPRAAVSVAEVPGLDVRAPDAPVPDRPAAAVAPAAASAGAPVGHAPAPGPLPNDTPARPRREGRSRRGRRVAALAAAAVVLGGAASLFGGPDAGRPRLLHVGSSAGEVDPVPASTDPRCLAVLYFDDHSPGRTLGYLADGLTEELITELSGVPGLAVTSRNAVKPYRARAVSFDALAGALRVGSLVEGSVQSSRGKLRVTVQLIDAGTGMHVGSRTFERPMQELFALQRDVTQEVAVFLRRRLGQEVRLRETAEGGRDPQALDAVLRAERLRKDAVALADPARTAVDAADLASADAAYVRADSLLAAAAARDPRWPRPVVARGWVALGRAALRPSSARAGLLRSALAWAEHAGAHTPRDAAARELRGTARWRLARLEPLGGGDLLVAGAEADLRAAVAADSLRAGAWATLSELRRLRGALAEADALAQRALAMDAYLEGGDGITAQLFRSAMALGDGPRARQWCARGHATAPTDWRFVECALTLMRLDLADARPDQAWALVRRLEGMDPPGAARAAGRGYSPVYRRLVAAAVSARAGDAGRARTELARALRETAPDSTLRVDVKYDAAFLHLALGERAPAERLLGEYLAAKGLWRSYLRRDPSFLALGLDPSGVGTVAPTPRATALLDGKQIPGGPPRLPRN